LTIKNNLLEQHKIVITGGPSTGKTTIIKQLEKEGFFCFPEFIRSITKEIKNNDDATSIASNPIISVSDPYDFNSQLLQGRIKQYTDTIATHKNAVFYDRGIPDVLAYMEFFNQSYDAPFIEACEKHRYTEVFILPPWKAIYTTDEERFETYEEAQQIYQYLLSIYTTFGYDCIEVPFGNIQERSTFILQHLL